MKIASWNVNSLNVRLPQLLQWLDEAKPDIVALQETKLSDDKFPRMAIEAAGYHVSFAGQKGYNGVALLSRAALDEVVVDLPGLADAERRLRRSPASASRSTTKGSGTRTRSAPSGSRTPRG